MFSRIKAIALAAAIGITASPAGAVLQFYGDFNGSVLACVDNAACDTNAAVGTIAISNQTLGGVAIAGSIQRSLGTPAQPFSLDLLGTSSLSVINTLGIAVTVDFSVSDTNFAAPVQNWAVSGSGVWELAGGSNGVLSWFADAANTQGANFLGDTPGTLLSSFTSTAVGPADSFAHNATGVLPMGALFSMTQRASGTIVAGGSLLNRGQTEIFTTSEPATLAIIGAGMVGLGLVRRRSNRGSGEMPQAA